MTNRNGHPNRTVPCGILHQVIVVTNRDWGATVQYSTVVVSVRARIVLYWTVQ